MRNKLVNHKTIDSPDLLRHSFNMAMRLLRHPIVVYLALVTVVMSVLLWRFPNLVTYPNFYAEDGSIFLQNIMNEGLLGALFNPFNGYFIVGLYLLCDLAIILNSLFGGDTLTLAKAFALTAIIFLAAIISLPYLLFAKDFGKVKVILLIAASAFMPLPQSPHTIIGVIGNQKFTFTYLAFLLTLFRLFNWQRLSWRQMAVIDLVLLICIYTNSVVYFLLPILALPYMQQLWRQRRKLSAITIKLLRSPSVISLLILYTLSLPQLAYVAINGIPVMSGYLDAAYQWSRTIEIFGNRTLLYGATHMLNSFLGDLRVLVLAIMMLIAGWVVLRGKERVAFFTGAYTALIASLLFVVNRPGVSDFFFGYKPSGSGPDQFFFAQTLIMYTPLTLLLFGIARYIPLPRLRPVFALVASAFVLVTGILGAYLHGSLWRHAGLYENYNQTFIDQALRVCDSSQLKTLPVKAYVPASHDSSFVMYFARPVLCTATLGSYQYSIQDLELRPYNNNFYTVDTRSDILQTFTASQNNLNGLQIFLSNFGKELRSSQYTLTVYEDDCKTIVRTASLPRYSLDNSYYRATFTKVNDSKNKKYCLTITTPSSAGQPLAIQLSAPGVYRQGTLRLNTTASEQDMVFTPTYSQVRHSTK